MRWAKMIVIMALIFSFSITAAELVEVTYAFQSPQIENIPIGDTTYVRITMPGASSAAHPGHPVLPVKGAQILIPYSMKVDSVKVVSNDEVSLGTGYLVESSPLLMPISADVDDADIYQRDPEIYSKTIPIPESCHEQIGTHTFRGYKILILKLNPVRYIPATGELSYYSSIHVVVHTSSDTRSQSLFRGLPEDGQEALTKIDNPEYLLSYSVTEKAGTRETELMILTLPWLVDAFQPLKAYHDSTGTPTEIYTIVDVLLEIGGGYPEDIRDFIRMKYIADGVQYVLIGDDHNLLPAVYGRDSIMSIGYGLIVADIPTDIFYACLDGPIDYDGDGIYGEPYDGENGGDVDLMADVYVGRAPVDDSLDVVRFINKTIGYLASGSPYLEKILVCGERTYSPGTIRFGKESLVELIDSSGSSGYQTIGIPSNLYNIGWLCAMDIFWKPPDIIAAINENQHIINHLGHNGYYLALKLTVDDLSLLSNSEHFFLYSQGCRAGGFDSSDCWAEHVTVKSESGAFGAVMNSREGWGSAYTTDSPSHRFNRQFWDAVFNPAENKPQLGRANHDSKEDNLFLINNTGIRWIYYETNLFGDPSISIKRPTAATFDFPEGIPSIIIANEPAVFRVNVAGLYDGSPVPGTGLLHYAFGDSEYQTITLTEIEPNQYEVTLPEPECGQKLNFYISVELLSGTRINDISPAAPHSATSIVRILTAFEDDFETNKGWNVSGGLWERGIPTGEGGEYGHPDPTNGCAGPNIYGYNLNGDYENELTEMHLTSPAIDCHFFSNVHLSFHSWLGLGTPPNDSAYVRISTDGVNWIDIWRSSMVYIDSAWKEMNFDISDIAAGQSTVYLRWTMGPTSESGRYCGWNIDDIKVVSHDCLGYFCGDVNGDENIDVADAVYLINYIFKGGQAPSPLESGDANCDGEPNVGDAVYLINYVFKGGPEPCCLQ
jgi:hypothetical protein